MLANAFEIVELPVVDTNASPPSARPNISIEVFCQSTDVITGETCSVIVLYLIGFECITVKLIKTVYSGNPHKAPGILQKTSNKIVGQPVIYREISEN